MAWQITWGGTTWTESDLTVGHAAVICAAQGADDWSMLNPFDGPVKLMGMVAALVAVAEQRAVGEVLAELAPVPMAELMAALSTVADVDDEPVDTAALDELAERLSAEALAGAEA